MVALIIGTKTIAIGNTHAIIASFVTVICRTLAFYIRSAGIPITALAIRLNFNDCIGGIDRVTAIISISGMRASTAFKANARVSASLNWCYSSPAGIHICVTHMHTQNGIADKFVADVRSKVALIMQNPEKPVEGKMAIYGVAQEVPDREVVGEFTKCFIDSMYYTVESTN